MTMPSSFRDRDQAKFKETQNGETSVGVSLFDSGSILNGISYDDVQITFPTSATELYTFFSLTIQVAQIELTYQDASKAVLTRARRL